MTDTTKLTVTVDPEDPALLVLCGEIDPYTAPDLEERLAGEPDGPLILDLADVTFMDSSGLRVLIAARTAREAHGGMTIRNPSPQVHRVLEISGLLELFTP